MSASEGDGQACGNRLAVGIRCQASGRRRAGGLELDSIFSHRFYTMTRLICFSLVVALTSSGPIKAQEKKDPPKQFTNSIGMKFVWIPPGTFIMGSPKEEKERQLFNTDETQHKVTLTKGFYMGVYTVTQEQYETVMGKNPSVFKGEKNLSVESVSWDDCQEFVKKLREKDKDKKAYRLPTEAEWEYACRAGTKTPFHFGETISTEQANYNGGFIYGDGKKGKFRNKTTPVGSFPANAFGLFDMHGNVWQWCEDWYGDYPQNDVVDPQGANKSQVRVLRGGSWGVPPDYCRSAYRGRLGPGFRFNGNGCRLCFFVD
jgi:formylglycine-generating enzyme required for sulfatase activity